MAAVQGLVTELEAVLGAASAPRRAAILQQVTDLFLAGAPSYSNDQITVFDVVLNILVQKMERQALIELGNKLASTENLPTDVIVRLSSDDDPMIAQSILKHCDALADEIILEVAKTKGQGHLLAIATRQRLSEAITTVLIERGGSEIMRIVVANEGAHISQVGFVKLINEAKRDNKLAEMISNRKDMPAELQPFLQLLRT